MRKLFLILVLSFGIAAIVEAQKLRRGYRGFYDWDFSVGIANSGNIDNGPLTRETQLFFGFIDTAHGYQFNKHIFTGVGLMTSVANSINNAMFPMYLDFRYDNTFGKYNLFFDMRGGTNGGRGIYLSPTVGYRFPIGKRMGFNMGVGMTVFGEQYDSYTYSVHYYNQEHDYYIITKDKYLGRMHNTNKMFTFRMGVDF